MDEAIFVLTMVGGGCRYTKPVIGREAANDFVNGIKYANPNITFTLTVRAYEFLTEETTTV